MKRGRSSRSDRSSSREMPASGISVRRITREGTRTVLSFLPYFAERKDGFGEWKGGEKRGNVFPMPFVSLAEGAQSFVEACQKYHFMQPFDWNAWAEKNGPLLADGIGVERANLECIVKMLTAHVRKDRFLEGHLLEVMESGLIGRILQRLAQLSALQSSTAGINVEWFEVAALENCGHGVLFFHKDVPSGEERAPIAFLEGYGWLYRARHARALVLAANSPVLNSSAARPEQLIADAKVAVLTVLLSRGRMKNSVDIQVSDEVYAHFNA